MKKTLAKATLAKKGVAMMVSGVAACLLLSAVSAAQAPAVEAPRVAGNVPAVVNAEHPLMPVIRWAESERPNIAAIKDYTAILQKQENIGGTLHGAQVLEIKIRHEPFSVYTKVRFPQEVAGQQAIFVKGKNNDKVKAHGVGIERRLGTLDLDPEGPIIMRGQKYPITDIGILNLIDKLLEVAYEDIKFGECEVTYHEDVKLGTGPAARECLMIQVMHPVPRRNFRFHVARIYVDKELNLPIRYESFDWPRREGEAPGLIEVYEYRNLKLNVGLTDADFDHANPAYNFP